MRQPLQSKLTPYLRWRQGDVAILGAKQLRINRQIATTCGGLRIGAQNRRGEKAFKAERLAKAMLAAFRARAKHEGKGYQTLINAALRAAIAPEAAPATLEALRQVLREELVSR